jgi:hypothetical protein
MPIILSFSATALLSSVMCCTTLATLDVLLLVALGAWPDTPVVADAAARGAESLSHLSAVPVVAAVACLDSLQLHKTALVRWT